MLADYDFYHNTYKGVVFTDSNTYEYFGERASDELAPYANMKVFAEDEVANTQLKKCACRISDVLYSSTNGGKSMKGATIASESVNGYYSVTYSLTTEAQEKAQINSAIKLYIGRYIIGSKRVMW